MRRRGEKEEGIEFSLGKASPDCHYWTGDLPDRADEHLENLQSSIRHSVPALVVQAVRGRKFRQELERGISSLHS